MKSTFLRIFVAACGLFVLAGGGLAVEHTVALPKATIDVVHTVYQVSTDQTGFAVNWSGGQLEVVGQGFALDHGQAAQRQARATAFIILLNETGITALLDPLCNFRKGPIPGFGFPFCAIGSPVQDLG